MVELARKSLFHLKQKSSVPFVQNLNSGGSAFHFLLDSCFFLLAGAKFLLQFGNQFHNIIIWSLPD
jgi:hypothetical protein